MHGTARITIEISLPKPKGKRVKGWLIMSTKRQRTPTKPARKRPAKPLAHIDPEALVAQQGVKPIANPEDLYADFWPADETADDFIQAVRQWRREESKRGRK
jgi:hypothetical protein